MPVTLAETELQTRELSAEDRARLASSLIESLETGAEENVEEAWRIEVEAGWASIEQGDAETIPASRVFAEIRRTLR